jgi:N-acetylmuramoyl-L-alanine amidase
MMPAWSIKAPGKAKNLPKPFARTQIIVAYFCFVSRRRYNSIVARSLSLLVASAVATIGAVVPIVWHDHSDRLAVAQRQLTSASSSVATPQWPDDAVKLQVQPVQFPAGFGVVRVYVDAGHGAQGNKGNLSSWCEDEQDFTLRVALHLVDSLAATEHFEARTRRPATAMPYADRAKEAEQWGARAFVSLHSDVRGATESWSPAQGMTCLKSDQAPGFAVLLSDEGSDLAVERRQTFAFLVASHLETAGFPPYDGAEYAESYEPIASHAGVFLDRHAIDKRIFVLRKPSMPSILIETHNALYPREAQRWREPATLEAFDAAVIAALVELLGSRE